MREWLKAFFGRDLVGMSGFFFGVHKQQRSLAAPLFAGVSHGTPKVQS